MKNYETLGTVHTSSFTKEEKGIAMVTLVTTIVLMLIIGSIIIYSKNSGVNMNKLNKMYSDIQMLQDKVDNYYAQNGELPIYDDPSEDITAIDGKIFNIEKAENDDNVYHKIDISKLDGEIKLNYDSDYYVNNASHVVYSQAGINMDGKEYHRAKIAYEKVYVDSIKAYKKDEEVNIPNLKTGMTPVKFTLPTASADGTIVETTEDDSSWYDYENKYWANAQTEDGSLWVWIPRFAYKINQSNQTTDVVFLIGNTDKYYDSNGNIQQAIRCQSETDLIDTENNFVVHPAFTDESNINFRNGGWDSEITGLWVAKFEAGYAGGTNNEAGYTDGYGNTAPIKASSVNYSQDNVLAKAVERGATSDGSVTARNWLDGIYGSTTTAIKYPTFQGSSYSMNHINHNDSFLIGRALAESGNIYGFESDTDSHLMKNSEWGAVAYLSKSQYGLYNVDINVNSIDKNSGGTSTTKANGNSLASVYGVTGYSGNSKEWNDNLGSVTSGSTTGNMYGIYDLSGGMYERTAAYVNNGNGNMRNYGRSITQTGATNTKYTTAYPQENYSVNTLIFGDAVKETSTAGTGSTSWYGDYSLFPGGGSPFFSRGGSLWYGSSAGLFSFDRSYGGSAYNSGFRAVLI